MLNGIRNRFSTPFFHALLSYSQKPKDVFHALPISQGKSVKDSIWISDLYSFYGKNVFMAETSSTQGGLDSLLDPKGAIKQAQDKAAISFGSDHTFFVTNGTSTANKIVMQATLNPGDIVLVASDCHKSIPYSIVLAGAFPIFFENTTFPEHDLVGPVELDHMIATLMDLKKSGDLHRVKLIVLTHCTFDGVLYDVKKVMTSLLAIKSDLIFHWDEAWFATGYFDPTLRSRCAAAAATELRKQLIGTSTQVRVYITQSTHKTLSSFRQGSMVHVIDDDYNPTRFVDAYRMHSTTSPNYQIIASLDVCRRQMDLEGFRLVNQSINLGLLLRHSIRHNPTLSQYFSVVDFGYDTPDLDIPIYPEILNRWHEKPFTVLPSRVTLNIKKTGMDGSSFRQLLISTYDIQVNKTSAHTVLFIITIGATEASVNHLLSALLDIANRLSSPPRTSFHDSQKTPITRHIHRAFRPSFAKENNRLCDLRTAYYSGMDNAKVTHVTLSTELIDALHSGITYVSAGFVTPYPPGFPVLIPGQIITSELATYLAQSKIKEIHGYHSETGLAVFRESYIESIQETINDD
ncbi:hypothetical protein EB093_03140 [bacterium]|nr:hypothetical protein [bacterium]